MRDEKKGSRGDRWEPEFSHDHKILRETWGMPWTSFQNRVVSSVLAGGCCGLDGADLGVKSEHCDLIANLILSNMGAFLSWPSPE